MASPHAIFDGLSAAFAELSSFAVTLSGQSLSLDSNKRPIARLKPLKNFTSAPPIPRQTSVQVPPNVSGNWECAFRCANRGWETLGWPAASGRQSRPQLVVDRDAFALELAPAGYGPGCRVRQCASA